MAGDWIKMRTGLRNHPKIVRIMSALCTDRFRIVGGLHAVWCVFDEFSTDGTLNGYSLSALDETIGWPGFAQAMYEVEWLQIVGNALVCPEFSTHNGESAKRRAEDAKRKKAVRNSSAKSPDIYRTKCGPEEEEEKKDQELHPLRAGDVGDFSSNLNGKLNGHDLLGDDPPAKPPKRKPVPIQAIVDLYHAKLPMLPRCEKVTAKREGQIRQRWEQDLPELEHWENYFDYVAQSKFLTGQSLGTNGRPPFRADIEWITNATNFTAIAEGKYHR